MSDVSRIGVDRNSGAVKALPQPNRWVCDLRQAFIRFRDGSLFGLFNDLECLVLLADFPDLAFGNLVQ